MGKGSKMNDETIARIDTIWDRLGLPFGMARGSAS